MIQNPLRVSIINFVIGFLNFKIYKIFGLAPSLTPMLDETVCTADLKQPLGSSTPTDASENKENMNLLPDSVTKVGESVDKEPKTPVSDYNRSVQFLQFI